MLAPIASKTIPAAGLTFAVSATDPNGDPLTYNARILNATPPISLSFVGTQLTVRPTSRYTGTVTVEVTASDGKLTSTQTFTATFPNCAALRDRPCRSNALASRCHADRAAGRQRSRRRRADLLGSHRERHDDRARQRERDGAQLTVTWSSSFVGSFQVQATVSDGLAAAVRSFQVTTTNAAPTLGDLATQVLAAGKASLTLPLGATDGDGDPLTFSAVALLPDTQAYQLDSQLGLNPAASNYYQNMFGANEKWFTGNNNLWYALLPDGRLYRWDLTWPRIRCNPPT